MAEESKYAGGATSLTDLRELVERQDLKIEALTALVRAQQITMDRLLRAVEKGAPVPAGAAHPIPSPFPSMPLAPIDMAAPAGLLSHGSVSSLGSRGRRIGGRAVAPGTSPLPRS